MREAVGRALEDAQALEGVRRPSSRARRGSSDAGAVAAPDAPAQLVELRQAEALGVLDDDHGRVRHVDADLDDRGRDQDVELAAP